MTLNGMSFLLPKLRELIEPLIKIYSREKGDLPPSIVEEILNTLREFGVDEMTELADSVFQIPQN